MNLTSISVPCLARDLEAFKRLLTYWSDYRLYPLRPGEDIDPVNLVVVVNRLDDDTEAKFKSVFEQFKTLHGIFRECLVFGAGLEGDRDLYVKDSLGSKGKFGNKAGPNFLFFATMRILEQFGGFTFQNELDCYPLRRGWLTDLVNLIEMRRFAWVIGSIFTASPPVSHEIQFHFNGNAIYQCGSREFIKFIDEVWEPRLAEYVDIYPNLAYDCWWALEQSRANSIIRNTSWQLLATYGQYFCNNQFLINTLSRELAAKDASESLRVSAVSKQKCVFIHGHANTPLVEDFYASSASDLRHFIFKKAADTVEEGGETSATDQDVSSFFVKWDEVSSPVVTERSRKAEPAMLGKMPSIAIRQFPVQLSPAIIPDECFVGGWHPRRGKDHVWTGKGKAALCFRFLEPAKRVRIQVNGMMAPGLTWDRAQFYAFGGKSALVDTNATSNSVSFLISDESYIEVCTIVFEVTEVIKVEGDTRELGFAMFHIQANAE